MEKLPYFLLLLKHNVLLCSVITSASFANVDLNQANCRVHSPQVVDFRNFVLGEAHTFSKVTVKLGENSTVVTFFTDNPDYFQHPEKYFGRDGVLHNGSPYLLNGAEARTNKKNLGNFAVFPPPVPPASVWVRHSSVYGYAVAVHFINPNRLEPAGTP